MTTPKPKKKIRSTADRLAAFKAHKPGSDYAYTRADGYDVPINPHARAGEAAAALVAAAVAEVVAAPEPIKIAKPRLVLAFEHASSLVRNKKKAPGPACEHAAHLFDVDPGNVYAMWVQTQPVIVAQEQLDEDEFDDSEWSSDEAGVS